jgi:hypothetical protein
MKIYEGYILSTITAPVLVSWEKERGEDTDLDPSHACYNRINSISELAFLEGTTFVLTVIVITIQDTEHDGWTDTQVL